MPTPPPIPSVPAPGALERRLGECPLRRERGCGEIDVALGWPHAMEMHECDRCWSLGGPSASDAADYREAMTRTILQNVTINLAAHHPRVVRAVIERHSTPAEAQARRPLLEAAAKRRPCPPTVWLGRAWRGYPWPKRPFVAAWAGVRAARSVWVRLGRTGCGCDDRCKTRVERAVAWARGVVAALVRRRRPA